MRTKKAFTPLIGLVIVAVFMITPVLAQETIKWKAQALWSPAEATYKTFSHFCERVKVLTNGRLEITPYPAGAIVPTFECLDAVKNNILQAMNQWPGYWTGKDPAFAPLTDLICAYRHPWEADAFFNYRGGLELLNELYKPFGVYCVGVTWWGIESFPSKFPIRRMEDFRGHKFRSPHGMTADLLTKLGASVVILPGGEVYSALDKGVIEGTDWGTPSMNRRMGFYQVAKYFIYPGFRSMPVGDFTVNIKEWNKLPADIKQILRTAVREWCWDQVEKVAIEDMNSVIEMKEKGITPVAWSEEDIARMRDVVQEVWDEWAKKSPMAKKVVEAQKDWLRELGRLK